MIFVAGQKVVVEYHTGRAASPFSEPTSLIVTKVGKKWVYLNKSYGSGRRFCITDDDDDSRSDAANDGPYALDGGDYGSPGRVWRDDGHRPAYVAKEAAWGRLTALARERSTMPAHLTAADLEAIADRLTPPGEDR